MSTRQQERPFCQKTWPCRHAERCAMAFLCQHGFLGAGASPVKGAANVVPRPLHQHRPATVRPSLMVVSQKQGHLCQKRPKMKVVSHFSGHYLQTAAGNRSKRSRSAKNGRPGALIGFWRVLLPQVGRKMQTCSTLSINLQRSEDRPAALYRSTCGFRVMLGSGKSPVPQSAVTNR